MSRPLVIGRSAEIDILEVFDWYEAQRHGLGEEFVAALDACLQQIQERPEAHARVTDVVRRALLQRFPYGVYFEDRPEAIVVLACVHGSRSPEVWRRRLN